LQGRRTPAVTRAQGACAATVTSSVRRLATSGAMKAYTYVGGGKLALLERDPPKAGRDTLVVRIVSAAICGTDLRTYRHGNERIPPSRIIGHEGCGVIEQVGPEVEQFRLGQRILVVPAVGCGTCRWCKSGATNMCERLQTVGFDFDGTFSEYMEVPARALCMGNVLALSDAVATEDAILAEPVACCVNGQEFLRIGVEDTVFIFGAGFIGCVHAELALKKGAKRVVISDMSAARLSTASRLLPNAVTFDASSGDTTAFVRELTEGRGADVVITACPSGQAHRTATQIAATRGRISLFGGIPDHGTAFLDSNAIHYHELSIFGSHASTVAQNRQVVDWIERGELGLQKYLSAAYPLERIEEAFEALDSAKVLKVKVVPGQSQ
jgi:L-iditol 2-dehydrogenase